MVTLPPKPRPLSEPYSKEAEIEGFFSDLYEIGRLRLAEKRKEEGCEQVRA